MTTICRTHKKEIKTTADVNEHSKPGCVVETMGQEYDISPFNPDAESGQGISDISYQSDVYDTNN